MSYLTIEYRGSELPKGVGRQMGEMFYGCDRCSTCCPWNRRAQPTTEAAFYPSEELQQMTLDDWRTLSVETYQRLFKGSAVKRAKYAGLQRNIAALSEAEEDETP